MNFPHLESAERTDTGRRRRNNEDAVLRLSEHGLFCVADGMGGAAAGELASQAAVNTLRRGFLELPAEAPAYPGLNTRIRLTSHLLDEASRWIRGRAEEMGVSGTGTTVVVLLFDAWHPSQGVCLHAGDSRVYVYRDDHFKQVTRDHSVAAAAGVSDEMSLPAFFRGVVTRAVGLDEHVDLEITPVEVHPGDLFLLCSDGLTKMLTDAAIAKLLKKQAGAADFDGLAQHLVDAANAAGGEDNVSVVLVRVADTLPQDRRGTPAAAVPGMSTVILTSGSDGVPNSWHTPANEPRTPITARRPTAGEGFSGCTPVSAPASDDPPTPVTAQGPQAGLNGGAKDARVSGWHLLLRAMFGKRPPSAAK